MLKTTIQIVLSLYIIGLFVPQTSKLNLLLRKLYESGFFRNWREAKTFLRRLSGFSLFLFYVVNYFFSGLFS